MFILSFITSYLTAPVMRADLIPVSIQTHATHARSCVRKKRKKRNKITQAKTLRKSRFPLKRNARKLLPIGMVDRSSQSSKQSIKRLRFLRFSFTQRTQRTQCKRLRVFRLNGNRALDPVGMMVH